MADTDDARPLSAGEEALLRRNLQGPIARRLYATLDAEREWFKVRLDQKQAVLNEYAQRWEKERARHAALVAAAREDIERLPIHYRRNGFASSTAWVTRRDVLRRLDALRAAPGEPDHGR